MIHKYIDKPYLEKYLLDNRFNRLAKLIAKWRKEKGFKTNWRCMPTKLLLVHSELSEATEALRDDDKKQFAEEIADTFIRLFDIVGTLKIDIEKEIADKMLKNEKRPYKHGKKF